MFSIWIWYVCVEIVGLVPMASKRASFEEFVRNVLRKVELSIDPSDGTRDEVGEDELEGLRKEKNRKYKQASRAQIAATNQEVKELLQLSNYGSIGSSTSSGVRCNTTYIPKRETCSIAMLVKNAILHLVRDLFNYEFGVQ